MILITDLKTSLSLLRSVRVTISISIRIVRVFILDFAASLWLEVRYVGGAMAERLLHNLAFLRVSAEGTGARVFQKQFSNHVRHIRTQDLYNCWTLMHEVNSGAG